VTAARDRIAGALPWWLDLTPQGRLAVAETLLPVVAEIAAEKAAEELRARAGQIGFRATEAEDDGQEDVAAALDGEAARLLARAAALAPDNGGPQ